MKKQITYVSLVGIQYTKRPKEHEANIWVFRGDDNEEGGTLVNEYCNLSKTGMKRGIILFKWFMGILSLKDKLYLKRLFK